MSDRDRNDNGEERYEAVLLGGHLGDSLGGPVETWSPQEIRRHYGRIDDLIAATLYRDKDGSIIPGDRAVGNWHAQQRPGEPSDDTILTLAVARALASSGYDLKRVAHEHIAAIGARRNADGTVTGGFGKTTLRAIERLVAGILPQESGVVGIGNAPPMKMAPVGLYMHATGKHDDGITFAGMVGAMTHRHTPSIVAGVAQAQAVSSLLQGTPKGKFIDSIITAAQDAESRYDTQGADGDRISERLSWTKGHAEADVEDAIDELRNDGRAICSYPFTIFMLLKHWDAPLEGLTATVNAGGDADTNGSMYGALAAARHGRFWPATWEERLEERATCRALGRAIARAGGA